jgi:hypothetical protein
MSRKYYLIKKINYVDEYSTPSALGCEDYLKMAVKATDQGFIWNEKLYTSLDLLNEEFYQKICIGKSSEGWYFALCIYLEYNINNIEDWIELFNNYKIVDENNNIIPVPVLLEEIQERYICRFGTFASREDYEQSRVDNFNSLAYNFGLENFKFYNSYDEILDEFNAERGRCNLWRRKKDQFVIHTDSTYDYIISSIDSKNGLIVG